MNSELIIDIANDKATIALIENKQLVEYNDEPLNNRFAVGDFYMGKVKKIMPGLNAAFVDVGYEKDAFLHYLDLGPQFSSLKKFISAASVKGRKAPSMSRFKCEPDIDKNGSIKDVLQQGQEIMVQIAKEPISTKGPRLTSELSLAGRYIVLMPFSNKVSVSQKIKSNEEKIRLKKLLQGIRQHNFGVIIRTVAENRTTEELEQDYRQLVKKWEEAASKIKTTKTPGLIYQEIGLTSSILRDILNDSFTNIFVNDDKVHKEIQEFVANISNSQTDIVKLYKGKAPILDQFNVTRQIKALFGRTVSFKSGSYLIIEHTEAMHVIDVNSGNRSRSHQNQETNALEVNLAAVDEIARQLRLRDMGGIVVIDFIDMSNQAHKQQVYDRMKEVMASDRAKHQILPLSKFCIMQITRQRVRPETYIETSETCPNCFGKGTIKPSIVFVDQIESKIDYLVNDLNVRNFTLKVHPYVHAYIMKGFWNNLLTKWKKKYTKKMKIESIQAFSFLQYQIFDDKGEEIILKEEFDKA